MCKVIIIPDASKIEKFNEFTMVMADALSSMPDGYGYAAAGDQGVFGVRTLNPKAYVKGVKAPKFCYQDLEGFGKVSKVIGPAMFHGRMSTNVKSLTNTHPISRDGWHLIHNGVVTDHGPKYAMTTSNDSEHVLYRLINGGIESVAANLTGYYACGAIDDDGLLHVFRDKTAPLYCAYSNVIESMIFATTEGLVHAVGAYIKEELVPFEMKEETYLVFSGGDVVLEETFKSRGWDDFARSHAQRSLGWENDFYEQVSPAYNTELSEYDLLDESYAYTLMSKALTYEEFVGLPFDNQLDCMITKDGRLVDIRSEFELNESKGA